MMDDLARRVAHAKSYPFAIPAHSYRFDAGAHAPLTAHDFARDGCVPVLAAGSNQSPEQLARKYEGHDAGPIHAQRGMLADFDVVYAAHFASYGSVPATFQRSPGTVVTVFVLWLDAAQLARMHATEGNYTYDRLSGIEVRLDHGEVLGEAYAYSSRAGCVGLGGTCTGLAEIAASNRRFPARGQAEIQELVRDALAPGVALDEFIAAHLDCEETRRARTAALGETSLPLDFARDVLGEY